MQTTLKKVLEITNKENNNLSKRPNSHSSDSALSPKKSIKCISGGSRKTTVDLSAAAQRCARVPKTALRLKSSIRSSSPLFDVRFTESAKTTLCRNSNCKNDINS